MENDTKSTPDLDVSDEKYAGPSAHVAALGNGVIKHLKWAGIGILGGGAYALVDPTHAAQAIKFARETATKLKSAQLPENPYIFTRIWNEIKMVTGGIIHFAVGNDEMARVLRTGSEKLLEEDRAAKLHVTKLTLDKSAEWLKHVSMTKEQGFGNWFLNHVPGSIPFVGKELRKFLHGVTETLDKEGNHIIKNEKWTNALTFGGAFGLCGYVSGWLKALISGAQHGNQGKRQFERAQEQIHTLQSDNADLNQINQELHTKYVRAASRLDNIQAAQDNTARAELPPLIETASTADPVAAAAAPASQPTMPTNEVQLSENQHQGKVAQPELAVA